MITYINIHRVRWLLCVCGVKVDELQAYWQDATMQWNVLPARLYIACTAPRAPPDYLGTVEHCTPVTNGRCLARPERVRLLHWRDYWVRRGGMTNDWRKVESMETGVFSTWPRHTFNNYAPSWPQSTFNTSSPSLLEQEHCASLGTYIVSRCLDLPPCS